MKKRNVACIAAIIKGAFLLAQSVQPGIVKEYNERLEKTPLSYVDITISNAASTVSGEDGSFILHFRTLRPGDKVNVRRIEKNGYEIFNKEALEQWFISRENQPFTIVMCKIEKFKRICDNYSRVSSESYDRQFKKEEARLLADCQSGKLMEAEYTQALKKLNDEYDRQLENLDNYIDHFARIDLSELSVTEAEIIEQVQRGEIEKAIQLYEQQNLEEKYKQQVKVGRKATLAIDTLTEIRRQASVSRDSIFASIKRKNETLRLSGGADNFNKIEVSLKEVALSDTTYLEAVWEYAEFAYQQASFYDAIEFYSIYIRGCHEEHKKILAYTKTADVQRKLKRYDDCAIYIDKASNLAGLLVKNNPDAYQDILGQVLNSKSLLLYETNQLKEAEEVLADVCSIYSNLASDSTEEFIYKLSKAQNNLGNVYRQIHQFDKAELFMELSMQNTEKLYVINPRKYLFDLASTSNNLGLIYRTISKNDQAEKYYRRAIDEMAQLVEYNPNAYREEYLRYLNNMGVLLKNLKRYEDAEDYYVMTLEQAEKLFSSNQEAYAIYLGNSLLNLGNLYIKMQRFIEAKSSLLRALPIIQDLYKRSPDAFVVNYFSVNLSLGNVCSYLEQNKEAESYMLISLNLSEELIKKDPQAFSSEKAMIQKNLGILYIQFEDIEKAEYYLVNALEAIETLYHEHPEIYEDEIISVKNTLGDFYKDNGDVEKARKLLYDTLELCKLHEQAHEQRIDKVKKSISELEVQQ